MDENDIGQAKGQMCVMRTEDICYVYYFCQIDRFVRGGGGGQERGTQSLSGICVVGDVGIVHMHTKEVHH